MIWVRSTAVDSIPLELQVLNHQRIPKIFEEIKVQTEKSVGAKIALFYLRKRFFQIKVVLRYGVQITRFDVAGLQCNNGGHNAQVSDVSSRPQNSIKGTLCQWLVDQMDSMAMLNVY